MIIFSDVFFGWFDLASVLGLSSHSRNYTIESILANITDRPFDQTSPYKEELLRLFGRSGVRLGSSAFHAGFGISWFTSPRQKKLKAMSISPDSEHTAFSISDMLL